MSLLLKRTKELLDQDERSLQDIARAADVSLFWLQVFKRKDAAKPNVVDVEKLYTHLAKKPLKV